MHILQLTVCAGVGGAAIAIILVPSIAPNTPYTGKIVFACFVLGLAGGFFGLRRYDAWRNGPM